MSLSLINEIWKVLKPSIELGDLDEAAENLVQYLIDEDYSPAEIKQSFRGDASVKEAVAFYLEKPEDGLYSETVEDIFDDYYNDDEYDDDDY